MRGLNPALGHEIEKTIFVIAKYDKITVLRGTLTSINEYRKIQQIQRAFFSSGLAKWRHAHAQNSPSVKNSKEPEKT